ncbi:hypothetical protein XANCAGTX0491_000455 [Xanthoria calcicola]
MSDPAAFDEKASRRIFTAPYTSHHPVPTVQDYKDERRDRDQTLIPANPDADDAPSLNKTPGFMAAAKERLLSAHTGSNDMSTNQQPYQSANRHLAGNGISKGQHEDSSPASSHEASPQDAPGGESSESPRDSSQTITTSNNPREKRKIMKTMNRDSKGREVTDPITHLPIIIHDATRTELNSVPENEVHHAAAHHGMEALFPPPSLEISGEKLASIVRTALTAGLSSMLGILLLLLLSSLAYHGRFQSEGEPDWTRNWAHLLLTPTLLLSIGAIMGISIILGIRFWVGKKVAALWEDGK